METILYSVRGPKSWTTMTSHELRDCLAQTDVALLPMGAIEQHAGHLPLGQDNFQIEEIVRRAILKLEAAGRKAIFGPTVPYGPISNLRFPADRHQANDTHPAHQGDLLNLYRDGIKNIALVMGHDMSLGR